MCDCIKRLNGKLREYNTELAVNLLNPVYCVIATSKVDRKKRGSPTIVAATFCPFCGKKYPETRSTLDAA